MSSAPSDGPAPMLRLFRPAFTASLPLSHRGLPLGLAIGTTPFHAPPCHWRHSHHAVAAPRRRRQKGASSSRMTAATTDSQSASSLPPPPPPPPSVPLGEDDRPGEPGIVRANLRDEMSRSYLEYAMSVILGRAMPDLRDGLKPVHRRILFAMHDMGLSPGSPFRKSARVVGEVLGKYHPHGDTAVYDALVRMAQTFSMSAPLVNGHGNFGSTDGDPPAAMRYTEARLAAVARDALLTDLDRETVEFTPTFDASEKEPRVLPARYPNLLVNGSSGIAVGMATNIPPHNLREVARAVAAFLRDPDVDDARLVELLPGPDFPTGGQIIGRAGIDDMNATGRGRIIMRACVHIETLNKPTRSPAAGDSTTNPTGSPERGSGTSTRRAGREALVVTELPYQVNKAVLVAKIADLVNEKKVEGVSDLRDESDRNGTRVVIELKRDAQAALVLSQLFQKTQLQTSFAANMVALDKGRHPIRLTLRDYLAKFISFRRDTVLRRVRFDLKVARDRLHIVGGLLMVQERVDDVIATIRGAPDAAAARKALVTQFSLSERQAGSVLDMQLRRLTQLESDRLKKERDDLETRQRDLLLTQETPSRVDDIILAELQEVAERFGTPRRSKLMPGNALNASSVDELTAFPNDKCVMVVTDQGYIKRMAISSFDSQNRGTRGKRGFGRLRVGDRIVHLFTCMTHDSLVALSSTGVAYKLAAHKVPMSSLGSRGVPIFQLLPFVPAGETIASVIPVSSFSESEFLVLLSRRGYIKKLALTKAEGMNARGRRVIILEDGDELMSVKRCTERDSMVIATRGGLVMRFRTDGKQLRSSGRASRGVRSIRLGEGDEIADMDVVEEWQDWSGATDVEGRGEEDGDEEDGDDEVVDDEDDEDDEDEDDVGEMGDEDAVANADGGTDEEEDKTTYLLLVTKNGSGKRVDAEAFKCQRRGGRGTRGIRLRWDEEGYEDDVVAAQACQAGDSVMLVASDGTIVRTRVKMIPSQRKRGRGVRMQRLGDADTVAAVAVLRGVGGEDDDDEDDEGMHDMEVALGLEPWDGDGDGDGDGQKDAGRGETVGATRTAGE